MLSLRDVCKTYQLKKVLPVKALDHVSVDFQEKGMVFILGKSGSGKSTMLNVIGGLDKADQGEVIIKGKSSTTFKGHDFDSYRNTFIGFVFQEYNLLDDFTIGKNIALALELQGRKATPEAIQDILTQVDMAGYENRKVNQISGGQKQRVAIARALIKSPEIILADEPTGALDSATGKQVFEILQNLAKDKLVIVVSHDRETAELYGDRIIEMKDGQILSDTSKSHQDPLEIRPGLSINQNVVHLDPKTHLQDEDLKLIDKLQKSNDTVILTRNKKLLEAYNFAATTEDKVNVKQYDGNLLKFISSKLKERDSLKIGASGLKHKRVRLFFTIILSFVSITFFALTDTMSAFKSKDAHARTLADNNVKTVEISQRFKTKKDKNGYLSYAPTVNFSDQHISDLKLAFPTAGIAPMVNENIPFLFDPITLSSLSAGNNELSGLLNSYNTNKNTVFINSTYLIDNDMTLLSGSLPTAENEYLITSFALEVFTRFSFPYYTLDGGDNIVANYIFPNQFNANKVNNANLVLNKSFNISNLSAKITGVINTSYESERFTEENLRTLNQDYAASNNLVMYMNAHNLLTFYRSDFALNDLYYKSEGIAERYFDGNAGLLMERSSDYTYSQPIKYIVEEQHLIDDLLVKFSDQPLTDEQIIISYNSISQLNQVYPFFNMEGYNEISGVPTLTFTYNNVEYEFDTINDFMTWVETPSNLNKLKDFFVTTLGNIEINNANKGNSYYESFEIAGLYFPTESIQTVGTEKIYYFEAWSANTTLTVNTTKQADFPLSLISRLSFTNNDDNLYNTYTHLNNYLNNGFEIVITSQYSSVFEMFGFLIEGLTIIFIVMGSILAGFSALLMMNFIATSISYKKRDIGILRGLGARKLEVVKIFTYESLIIAAINIVLSIAVSIPAVILINQTVASQIGADLTLIAFTLRQVGLIVLIAIASALLASILPVLGIARKKPIDAINNR